MKTLLLIGLTTLFAGPVHGQFFNRDTVGGALFGGLLGGVVGHNNGRGHTAEGVAIGAASGFLLGAMNRQSQGQYNQPPYPPSAGYPPVNAYPYPAPASVGPNYTATGAALGGLAGGIIGHNQGSGHTAEGAAIGAASGLLLGGIADHQMRKRAAVQPAPVVPVQPATVQPAPAQPVPAVPTAPVHAIPDAPTVPDAPIAFGARGINPAHLPVRPATGVGR